MDSNHEFPEIIARAEQNANERCTMNSKLGITAIAFGLAALTSASGHAQNNKPKVAETAPAPVSGEQARTVEMSNWNYEELYRSGWRAENLMNADVIGRNGNEIGDVENIMISKDGKILSVIAEIGGFLDIGDTHVSILWKQVQVASDGESIRVPITEDNIKEYSFFGENGLYTKADTSKKQQVSDDLTTGPRVWRATELMGDYVRLKNGTGYGYVDDLIFNKDGSLNAVVVTRDVGYGPAGPYAYPFYGYGYGFDPGLDYYTMPFAENEVARLDPYDYAAMEGGIFE